MITTNLAPVWCVFFCDVKLLVCIILSSEGAVRLFVSPFIRTPGEEVL